MSRLFKEYQIKDMKLRNRIVMPPMCMYSAEDGLVNDWHLTHYTTRAVGGAGLILLEATGVESRGRITDQDLGLWKDEQVEGMARLVGTCRKFGAKMGVQLAHAGRKSEVTLEQPVAPSPIAFSEKYRTPSELKKEELPGIINAFRDAAVRAEQAGFDTIELHAAHGYLISEFLSPLTNQRTDEYGGSAESRSRLLAEIIRQVRSVWPEKKPLIVRVSAEDYEVGGNHVEAIAEILKELKAEGIDLVNVSSGGVVNTGMKTYPGYQVGYAETIRRVTGIPVIAGGLITSAKSAEKILKNEQADLIYFGRELLRNPYFPLQASKEVEDGIEWPVQYQRAK